MSQWVDITTIDNSTPFSAVRWLSSFSIDNGDAWFSEADGLVTDGMSWDQGNYNYGSYGSHRFNGSQYTCAFSGQYKVDDGADVDPDNTPGLGYAVRDADRNAEYDNTVVINNETYYEVDFSTWQGYSPLYFPFDNSPVSAGSIYVCLVEPPAITGNTDSISMPMSGGTDSSLEITSEKEWTADTGSANWITVLPGVAQSGTTQVSITVPDNTAATRSDTVYFKSYKDGNLEQFGVTVTQQGHYGVTSETTSIRFKASGETKTLNISADDTWTAYTENTNWCTISPNTGNAGVCALTLTVGENTGDTRFDDLVLISNWNSQRIYIEQKLPSAGIGGVLFGELEVEAMYLGDVEVEALYLGDIPIAESGPPTWKVSPSAITVSQVSASTSMRISSPTSWTLDAGGADWVTLTPSAGTSGRTSVAVDIDEYTGSTSRNVTITAMTTDSASSATCVVTQNYVSGLTVPHLVNFNAKLYNPSTFTIPNDAHGTLPYDLVLTNAPDGYDSSSITVSTSYGSWSPQTGNPADNPFNSPNYLTIIAKTDNYLGGYVSNSVLVGNRNESYNWMVKQDIQDFWLHTINSDPSSAPYVTATTQPNIWMIAVMPDNGQLVGYGKSYTDNLTSPVVPIIWGGDSSGVSFLSGYYNSALECWTGKLYWLFISNSYLSGTDVQDVIDYNENL